MQPTAIRLPARFTRVLISVNPTAGSGSGQRRVECLAELLAAGGYRVDVVTDLDEMAQRAERYFSEGTLRAVVAAGGDGTVAEVVNRTGADVPLAVLPLGTENLLAKYLCQRPSAEAVFETIDQGISVKLDAACANGRIFLLMVGVGFDAEVVRRVEEARSGHITHAAYVKPIWDSIRSYQYPELRVYCDRAASDDLEQAQPSIAARWLFAFNLPRYGGGIPFAPQAVGTDGLLDVCTFRRGSFWQGLRYLACIVCRQHERLADCVTAQTPRFRVEADVPVPYQIDGDLGGWLPLAVEVLPGRLSAVVPRRWVAKQGYRIENESEAGGELGVRS
ncbi:MAG: NAD(+)/NADH kinase [Planctomycetes bacterium]|nr:NAD(+)/NADH kinase [Planctomycetota bacterium]